MIEWILDRCRGEADAMRTPIGYVPTPESLDLTGLDLPAENLEKLFAVNRSDWYAETEDVASFFQQFGTRFPRALWDQLESLRQRLRTPITLLEAGRGDPSPGQGTQRHDRAREPARLRHALRPGQAALLPQGHSGPEPPRPRTRPSVTTPRSASRGRRASRCSCPR